MLSDSSVRSRCSVSLDPRPSSGVEWSAKQSHRRRDSAGVAPTRPPGSGLPAYERPPRVVGSMSGPYKLRAGTPLRVRARQIAAGQDAEDPAARAALSVGLKPKAFTEASEKVRFRGRNREFLDARCGGLTRTAETCHRGLFADLIQDDMYACRTHRSAAQEPHPGAVGS